MATVQSGRSKYRAPKIKRREVLGFFGDDKAAAWAEAFRLAEALEDAGATWKMGVQAERQHVKGSAPEWIVVLLHFDLDH